MEKPSYDAFGGYSRLAEALENIDDHAVQVMTFHVALERELDEVLATLVKRPQALDSGMGFGNKLKVLRAVWAGEEDILERAFAALHAFNEHRNRIAHGKKKEMRGTRKALLRAYQQIDGRATGQTAVAEIAQGIVAYIGQAPLPPDLKVLFDEMGRLGEAMSRFGRQDFAG